MIWWTKSWNPVIGCTKCSPACDHCYAEALHTQRHKAKLAGAPMPLCYAKPFDHVRFLAERLEQPLHWRKPQRIFVGNMGDLFHEDVTDAWLDQIFATMARCPQHTFMLCTKRPELMAAYLKGLRDDPEQAWRFRQQRLVEPNPLHSVAMLFRRGGCLPNVWLGTTIWDQPSADRAVPILLSTPAAKRFVSVEPMLGPVMLTGINWGVMGDPNLYINALHASTGNRMETCGQLPDWPGLDWVICGGETGAKARPMHPDWPRSLRDRCQAAKVPFFFKQWGEWAPDCLCQRKAAHAETPRPEPGKMGCMFRCGSRRAGRVLDGRTWEEVPNADA